MSSILGRMCGASTKDDKQREQEEEKSKELEAIVQGLAQYRVVWGGGVCADGLLFIKQTHVLIGIFACHRMHPYSRCERFCVWLCLLCAGLGLSLLFVGPDGRRGKDRGAHAEAGFVALVICIMHFVLQQVAMARCCAAGGMCYCWGAGDWVGKCAGNIILFGALLIAIVFLFAGVRRAMNKATPVDKAIAAWVVSQIYSNIGGVLISVGMYVYQLYGCCCCNPCSYLCGTGQGLRPPFQPDYCFPHGPEYPKDMHSFWQGDRFGCYHPDSNSNPGNATLEAETEAPKVRKADAVVVATVDGIVVDME